tara:strand:+ start:3526 stop:4296 length:771 start_codon:yes stop_codon:yes gene_type:complete
MIKHDSLIMNFDGEVAVVTGAATGIGEMCAKLFASRGANVVVMDFDKKGVERVANDITGSGGKALVACLDLTDWLAIQKSVKRIENEAGHIHSLVHSAGGFPQYISLTDLPVDEWDDIVDNNLKSFFLLLKAITPLMKKNNYGRIISLSSAAARVATHSPHYTASKGGLLSLTRQAAKEFGPFGITVNSVAPANVNTPRTIAMRTEEQMDRIRKNSPLGRMCDPEEIAWPILFLCSRQASYITGVTLDVNGGIIMI